VGFKMTLELDADQNPDAIGEALRSRFFDEKIERTRDGREYRQIGCYQTFDWRSEVAPLPDLPLSDHNHPQGDEPQDLCWGCTADDAVWIRGEMLVEGELGSPQAVRPIECRYFWDGDGTLAFKLPDGRWLINDDCKKDHGWELHDELFGREF
jgi:hypothetical protein